MTNPAIPHTMRAAVLTEPGLVTVEDRQVPVPNADEVLVAVLSVGVCGSDTHYYREGRIGPHVVEEPLILGHEASGTIAAVGAGVPPDRVGERVAIEPQRPCRVCRQCIEGRYNLCQNMQFFGTPPVDGAFCEYVTVPSPFAHPVPDSLSDEDAALLEPLSVAISACRKAHIGPGASVLVAGAGPVGLLTTQTARCFGASSVTVSDPVGGRREVAQRLGATAVVDPLAAKPDQMQVDAFVDCSGSSSAIQSGIRAVQPAGTVVLVGMGTDETALPIAVIQNRELTLTGVFRYAHTWPLAIELVASGRVNLAPLVTGYFNLDEAAEALDADRTAGSLKAIVRPQEQRPARTT
jgi:L-iditol 2-dehydrogenase